jgi:hypothetical protein
VQNKGTSHLIQLKHAIVVLLVCNGDPAEALGDGIRYLERVDFSMGLLFQSLFEVRNQDTYQAVQVDMHCMDTLG